LNPLKTSKRLFFQRSNPNDPSFDLPASGSSSDTDLGRNRYLLEYLRRLTGRSIPGFGGSFSVKYNSADTLGGGIAGIERDQILTQIFDYIRSSNIVDQSLKVGSTNPVNTYTAPLAPDSSHNYGAGQGQVVPIVDSTNGTRGFGRFPTLQQASLVFFPSSDNGATPTPTPNQMQAAFVLQLADPSMGYPWNYAYYTIEVSGLNSFTWDGTSPMWTTSPVTINSPYNGNYDLEPMTGGIVGWTRLLINNHSSYGANLTPANQGTRMYSTVFPAAPPPGSTFASQGITGVRFTGGPVTIDFYAKNPNGSKGAKVQSITISFPNAPATGFPLPDLSTTTGFGPAWSKNWQNRLTKIATPDGSGKTWTLLGDRDVSRSILASPGDTRLVAARGIIPSAASGSLYAVHPRYGGASRHAHALRTGSGSVFFGNSIAGAASGGGRLVPLAYDQWQNFAYTGNPEQWGLANSAPRDSDVPTQSGVAVGKIAPLAAGDIPGDWDNGVGNLRDGPYINKADEGDNSAGAYFDIYGQVAIGETFFSPNRMVPSAGMFGSLPTGVLANKPWQTLLFRPGPAGHPGLGSPSNSVVGPPYTTPPDHLLLDLFSMPVVEPYAISEPLSTAGKVNMNYQIVPFSYINRETALRAALKASRVIAVPDADANRYKQYQVPPPSPNNNDYRLTLNTDATLSQFQARFNNKDIFRSASEICSIDLVPSNYTGSLSQPGTSTWRTNLDSYWNSRRLTGDNSRERPYANLYPLLTTKSNTFNVHYRAQSLKRTPGGADDVWDESKDKVTGEYRGSQIIERFIDPNDPSIPDYADPSVTTPISDFYKFRMIQSKQFAP